MPGGRGDKSNMKGVSWQEDRKYLLIKGQSIHERSPVTVNAGEGVGHINDLQGPTTLAMRASSFSNSHPLSHVHLSFFINLFNHYHSLLPHRCLGTSVCILWIPTPISDHKDPASRHHHCPRPNLLRLLTHARLLYKFGWGVGWDINIHSRAVLLF